MAKVTNEDLKNEQRLRRAKRGLKVVIVVGVGASLYGYKLGRKRGYLEGMNAGYASAGHELVATWKKHAEEMRLAREAMVK